MDHFISLGRYFGYPECCIEDFLYRVELIKEQKKRGLKQEKIKRKFHGTGYVPCPQCNKLDMATLIRTINANRGHDKPFPIDGKRRM